LLFQPSIHGWPFTDALTLESSAGEPGEASSEQAGLGAGMCWTALDRYLGGVRIARDTAAPEPGDPLYAELLRRHASAVCGLWPRVREWQALSDRVLAWRTRRTLRDMRRALARAEPVLLTLLPESDPYLRGRAARHVLATGWSRARQQVTLSIYDPARPDDNGAYLRFSRSGALDGRLASGEAVRGFFPVPYEGRWSAPLRAESFADCAVLSPARPAHGRIAAVASGERLDVVARSRDGTLLHFRRGRRTPWSGASIAEQEGVDRLEMHGDPALLEAHGSLHAFARGYVGDLLHFSLSRNWAAANRTDHKRTGPRFRLAGRPVPLAGPWPQLHVFGRDKDSGIVHYRSNLLRRWSAEQIAGDPIVGDPVVVRIGRIIHLFGVSPDGRILHWERAGKDWVPRNLTTSDRTVPPLLMDGPPAVVLHDSSIHLVGRDRAGRLAHFRRAPDSEWTSIHHGVQITGDPAAMVGPAGVHVFAMGPEGQLFHRWGDTEWKGEDLAATRASLDLPGETPARLSGRGTASELNVVGHWGDLLMTLTWRSDSDWVAVPLSARAGVTSRHLPAEDPIVIADGKGHPHLFGIDPEGSVIHIEPAGRPSPGPRPGPRPDEVGNKAARPAPVPAPQARPADPTATEPEQPAAEVHEPYESVAELDELGGLREFGELEEPPADGEPWEVPLTAELTNGTVAETEPTEAEAEPERIAVEAEPEAIVVDVEPEPVTAELPTEAAKPKRRGVEFEPMDLTSLEMVPPLPSSRRRRQRKKG
jgi:hypothetical protein